MSVQVIFLVILGFGNDSASQAFELLKSHAGQWQGTAGAEGQEGEPAEIVLKVTAAGSAVVETLFPGTEHEMVSVYHLEQGELVMTHYCAAGNQPKMKLVKAENGVLAFDYLSGAGIDTAKDMHMHSAKIDLSQEGKISSSWTGWADGQAQHEMKFNLSKK